MTKFNFEVTIANHREATDELAEATFAAGCDDATMASRDGVVMLTFRREADNLESAIASAIRQLRSADCEVSKIEILGGAVAA